MHVITVAIPASLISLSRMAPDILLLYWIAAAAIGTLFISRIIEYVVTIQIARSEYGQSGH